MSRSEICVVRYLMPLFVKMFLFYEIYLAAHHGSHDGEKYHPRQQSDRDGYQKHEDIGYGKSFFMVMGSVLRSNYKR